MDSLDSDTLISEKPSDPVFSLNKPEGIFAFPKGALSGGSFFMTFWSTLILQISVLQKQLM